ncbi:MAG: radical SAM protein [Oligoflexia bacterium]|nr:radical SAM protein [Oligoflexia bacterium]MBF0364305.1 radical SAM protein [Oligoflexia bacterium]
MKLSEIITLTRMVNQVVLAKVTKSPRPVSVNLQVTKFCNLKCDYCFSDLDSLKEEKEPTLPDLFETIDELYRHGCRHIILMGGEPLIRKDIGIIISYIKKTKKMRCELVTNGYFISNHLEALKLCDSVCISLDGPKEANDIVRGDGCHDQVLKGMDLLKAHSIKTRIHAVLTKYNIKIGLDYVAKLSKRYHFPFNFSMIMLRPEMRPDFIAFTEEEIQSFLTKYRNYKRQGYLVFTSEKCFEHLLNWPLPGHYTIYEKDSLTPAQKNWVVPCNYGKYNAFVDVDGKIYKCCLTWKNGLNWREHGMKRALTHIGSNLIQCTSCRSIGDIERALLLRGTSLSNLKMVFKYLFKGVRYDQHPPR